MAIRRRGERTRTAVARGEFEQMRRVVTGVDENGKSAFVRDEEIEPLLAPTLGGVRNWNIWGSDETSIVPLTGEEPPKGLPYFPFGSKGYRFIVFSYPPASHVPAPIEDFDAAIAETERMMPGMSDAVTESGGMHSTKTVDLEYVLAGEFYLELDNGTSTILKAGDSVVQGGAVHRWENRSDSWATMLLVFIGAELDASRFT
jgi:hypothetical protein